MNITKKIIDDLIKTVLKLRFKFQPFIALLISSILVGVLAGVAPAEIINTVKEGMGSTLGFVAVVVGLGAMFGAILEHSGGAEARKKYLGKDFKVASSFGHISDLPSIYLG